MCKISTNSDCNTRGQTVRIWVNVTALAITPDCYSSQMRYVYNVSRISIIFSLFAGLTTQEVDIQMPEE